MDRGNVEARVPGEDFEVDLVERVLEGLYLATAGQLLTEAQSRTPDSVGRLLLIAHNPGMEELLAILSGKREGFPTAALAVFEVGIESWHALELGVETRLVKVYRPKELE